MKQSVLDVLMYLFENYMDDDSSLQSDPEKLRLQLSDAGFMNSQINKAFNWLEDLAQSNMDEVEIDSAHQNSFRVFNDLELQKLNTECQGFLSFLEQAEIIDTNSRELIIDRVMALESDEIDLEQLKWIILMVLFNQPEIDTTFNWLEHLVMEDLPQEIH